MMRSNLRFFDLPESRGPWALLAAALLLTASTVARANADESIDLVFTVKGQAVTLSDEVRDKLRSQADKIVRRCSYDAGDQEAQVWREALAEPSFIRLIYATPITLRLPRRELLVSEALFVIPESDFIGQPILRHEERTTLVFKCDGLEMIRLMCMPELEGYFPPGFYRNCHILRQR